MIRINLLPEARREVGAAASPQVWLIVYGLSAVVWCVLLGVVYWKYDNELQEKVAANKSLQEEIDRAERQNADLDTVKAQLAKSKKLEEVVTRLQKARLGPTSVLMELSKVLSAGGGPTIDEQRLEELRRENPLAGYNPGWDIRRLWLKSFSEKGREVKIAGTGKTNEDVAEFLRRLALSEVFDNVTLEKTSFAAEAESKLPMVDFSLSCKVDY